MSYPKKRMRRLRKTEGLRRLVRETAVSSADLVMPLFVVPGTQVRQPIASMPGIERMSVDLVVEEVAALYAAGISAVLLFGVPDTKDAEAHGAYAEGGLVQEAVRRIKSAVPDMVVITDVCVCAYTSHGHCGVLRDDQLDNDRSLSLIADVALSHAVAGADMVAPSAMLDGQVGAIRAKLDQYEYEDLPIMAYAAKYASAFYGPFRDAADSAPGKGDRRSYQMDPPNSDEAVREVMLDIEEGADIVMVKPALSYLDIISKIKDRFHYPTAAYNVSGEYAMVKAAAANNWIDEKKVVTEMLTGMKRAGADIIITYHAKEFVGW